VRPVKLYISSSRALCAAGAPLPVSTLWQQSAASLIPTVASATAAAPTASFAVTGGVAALGGVEVPGGVEVQGGTASRGPVSGTDLRTGLGSAAGTGLVSEARIGSATGGTTSTIERVGSTARVRTFEQTHAMRVDLLDRREVQVQGTSGLTANDQHDLTAPKPNGGVRGTPPRGRPV
jgi:hypothetical protein